MDLNQFHFDSLDRYLKCTKCCNSSLVTLFNNNVSAVFAVSSWTASRYFPFSALLGIDRSRMVRGSVEYRECSSELFFHKSGLPSSFPQLNYDFSSVFVMTENLFYYNNTFDFLSNTFFIHVDVCVFWCIYWRFYLSLIVWLHLWPTLIVLWTVSWCQRRTFMSESGPVFPHNFINFPNFSLSYFHRIESGRSSSSTFFQTSKNCLWHSERRALSLQTPRLLLKTFRWRFF